MDANQDIRMRAVEQAVQSFIGREEDRSNEDLVRRAAALAQFVMG